MPAARNRPSSRGFSLRFLLPLLLAILVLFSLLLRYGDKLARVFPSPSSSGEGGAPEGNGEQAAEAANRVKLQILNGTGIAKLALTTGELLREMGVDVLDRGNAPPYPFPETILVVRGDALARVEKLADRLGGIPVFVQRQPDLMLDATLVLGQDWRDYAWTGGR